MDTKMLTAVPQATIGKILGVTGSAIGLGRSVVGQVTSTVVELLPGSSKPAVRQEKASPKPTETVRNQTAQPSLPTPINVVEELDLDAAPVEVSAEKPVTQIDAAADVMAVEVTPADIAPAVAKKKPAARKSATKKAPARKPASSPGDTLPAPKSDSAS